MPVGRSRINFQTEWIEYIEKLYIMPVPVPLTTRRQPKFNDFSCNVSSMVDGVRALCAYAMRTIRYSSVLGAHHKNDISTFCLLTPFNAQCAQTPHTHTRHQRAKDNKRKHLILILAPRWRHRVYGAPRFIILCHCRALFSAAATTTTTTTSVSLSPHSARTTYHRSFAV